MIQLFKCFKINDTIFIPVRFRYDTDTGSISTINCISINKDYISCDDVIIYDELYPNIINIDTNVFLDTFKENLRLRYTKGQPIRSVSDSRKCTLYIPQGNVSVFINEGKHIIATVDNIEIFGNNQFLYIPIEQSLTIGDIILIKRFSLVSGNDNKMMVQIYSIQINILGQIIKINGIDITRFHLIERIDNELIIKYYFNRP